VYSVIFVWKYIYDNYREYINAFMPDGR